MASPRPIRTAVLGFGVSGRVFHAPFLACDPAYSLDVVVTGDANRAAQARATHPGVAVVGSADDVFERAGELDLVVIGTPPGTHADLATRALDAGLHVVVDKPFTPTSAEGAALVEHARSVGRLLTVFQNRRWDTDFLTLRALVGRGELGRVHTFESRFESWKPGGPRSWKADTPVSEGGGILFDLGTHLIDQAIRLFGPVESVWADVTRRTPGSVGAADDDTLVVLRHRDGTRSQLSMSSMAARPGPRFHVLGSEGAYTKWGLDPQEAALREGVLPTDDGYAREPEENWGVLGAGGDVRRVEPERGSYAEFYRLLALALAGEGDVPVDPHDAVEVLTIIEEAHRVSGTR
ncbi:Gfo/Idh/MocA family protein [Saccharomonospora cyanea]|uniref:Putative dehydrogenase n=1 Tax=Saccharomonospora cyanea NA-134 TaxID=882082 RepID=H5XJW0_9PSEU|nr:Gfo/Idh/MocA family oxidoreductase [Saccharomonospora cyanea]EHR61875.1 putative dehydrogenase [Saccharomonospora cyanea NA-134]